MSTIKSKQLEGVKADQLLSNNITAVVDPTASQDISQGYFPSSVWVNTAASPAKVFVCSDNSIGSAVWNQIAPSASAQTITQTLHGFTVGQVLKHSAGSYSLAQADSQANLGIWLVTKVIDANTFQAVQSGYVTGLSGGTADETWYLSDTTAGGLVNTAPTIAQPIIYWITASEGWVLGYPATSSGAPVSGSAPQGYNAINFTKSGANLTVEGNTVVSGSLLDIAPTVILITGAAGNRYVCISSTGAVTVEAIPPAEIFSDTSQYSPVPPYNQSKFGYYSSVNPSLRIVGFFYFDGSQILSTNPYGNNRNRKDNFWMSSSLGVTETTNGNRLQFLNGFDIIHGDGISCVDNGSGNTDVSGFRITANRSGILSFSFNFYLFQVNGNPDFSVNKNGSVYINNCGYFNNTSGAQTSQFSFREPVEAGDYFTFQFIVSTNGTIQMSSPRVLLEEV